MDVIVDNITPSQKKKLRVLRSDYEFTSPEQKKIFDENFDYYGNRQAIRELQEDKESDKAPTSRDLIDDPDFWVDIDSATLNLAILLSTTTKGLFSSFEANRKDKKFDEFKSRYAAFPSLIKVFDELKITNYKLFDEKFTEVKNKYIIAETEALTGTSELNLFLKWHDVLRNDLGGYPEKIYSVLIKMGLSRYVNPLDTKIIK